MGDRLKGKVAVITGSGHGVGRAIARCMAEEGARVITNNRKPGTRGGDAGTVAKEITDRGGEAIPFYGDVSGFEVAHRLIQTAVQRYGRLDILVNNAGIVRHRPIWDLTEEDYDAVVDCHLKGTFNCIRHASPIMMEQRWGRIINCASGVWLGSPGVSNYGAAKAGIVGLTRCVACDLGEYGVTCNAYHPFARTRLFTPGLAAFFKKRYELGLIDEEEYKWQTNPPPPEGVAPMVVYLSTDAAATINGRVFYLSGGKVAIYSEPVRKMTIMKEAGFWTVEELVEKVPKALLK